MKGKTREAILDAALILFRKEGIDAVSTRDIAKAVNISVGNLTYYFPAKVNIIHSLCNKLLVDVNEELEISRTKDVNALHRYYLLMKSVFTIHLRYRFLFEKRFAEIITSIPEVQCYYQNSLQERFSFRKELHESFVKEELAQPFLLEETTPLSYTLNILGLYWHQEISIYSPDMTDHERIDHTLGDSDECDHSIPAQADHPFRAKLTRAFRGKLTTPNA